MRGGPRLSARVAHPPGLPMPQGYRTKIRVLTDRDVVQRQIGGKRFDEEDAKAIVAYAMNAAQRAPHLAYHVEGAKPRDNLVPAQLAARSSPAYRNPIALVQEWHRMLASGECATRANLARQLGMTRGAHKRLMPATLTVA